MQIYSEMIGNVMTDARSTGKYYHCKCSGCKHIRLCYALYLFPAASCTDAYVTDIEALHA